VTDGGAKATDAEIDLVALLISEGYTPDVRTGPPRTAHFCNSDPSCSKRSGLRSSNGSA